MATLEDHPLAAIFPLMEEADLDALGADIAATGLRDPVWLFEGKVLDGRNRYRACLALGIDARTEEYQGYDPLGFVISKNLHRRHLTESQRAMVAANIAGWQKGQNQHENRGGEGAAIAAPTREQAAQLLNVSTDSIDRAKAVKAKGVPELAAAVEFGEVTVSAAAEVAKLPKAEQRRAVLAGKVKQKAAEARKAKRAAKATKAAPPPAPTLAASGDPDGIPNPGGTGSAPAPTKIVPPPALDAWGIPIQEHALGAFAAAPKFRELLAAVRTAQRLFNETANLDGGKFLTLPEVSSYRRGAKQGDGEHADRFVHEGLERAFKQIKAAVPTHTVCPYQYADAPHPAD